MSKTLVVLIDGAEIGHVTQDSRGKFHFAYVDAYRRAATAIPLSVSMPLSVAKHDDKAVRPFLWGLLPDNDDTLTNWGKRFGVSPRNPFALLSEVGEDQQGAIQIVPPDQLDHLRKREGVTPLSHEVLVESFAALVRDPGATQFTKGGGQFSLAGAQRKKALYLVNGRWYEPRGRTPSTHVLKPPITGLAGQVENEMFCQRLAPRLGLPAPKTWVEVYGDIPVVVVERYDRRRIAGRRVRPIDSAGGEVHRVHQEDCCQALMVDPRNKYQRDGGPGMRQIMELLSGSGRPAEDRDRFMRACAYSFVIAGTDAHAKNYGLLLAAGGRYRLAPLYDIASWLPYSKEKRQDRLAMSVDRKYHIDEIRPSHWQDEARKCGYSQDRAIAHIRDILARLPDEAAALVKQCRSDGIKTGELAKLADLMVDRARGLTKDYGEEIMPSDQDRLPGL